MKKIKTLFNSLALVAVLSLGAFFVAVAQEESLDMSLYGSEEELIKAVEEEEGGEDEDSADMAGSMPAEGYQEYDPDPIPTLENSIEQDVDMPEVIEDAPADEKAEKSPQAGTAGSKEIRFSFPHFAIFVLAGVALVVLAVFLLKKLKEDN